MTSGRVLFQSHWWAEPSSSGDTCDISRLVNRNSTYEAGKTEWLIMHMCVQNSELKYLRDKIKQWFHSTFWNGKKYGSSKTCFHIFILNQWHDIHVCKIWLKWFSLLTEKQGVKHQIKSSTLNTTGYNKNRCFLHNSHETYFEFQKLWGTWIFIKTYFSSLSPWVQTSMYQIKVHRDQNSF